MNTLESLIKRDRAVIWHPCTLLKIQDQYPPLPIARAEGIYLEDVEGRRYVDAVGSWWVCLLGHQYPPICEAIAQQLKKLSQVMFSRFTHLPAIELAERLVSLTDDKLSRVFFSDNGSSATEIALKMSYHTWQNQAHTAKKRFMHLEGSYHGETLGALSVTGSAFFQKQYQDLLIEAIALPCPTVQENQDDIALQQIKLLMEKHHHETCALIVEPLVQCASGIRIHSVYFLKKLYELCQQFEIHFIADEIAVGFGRTGHMFAYQEAEISPDFLCLSKGITGGTLPLSVVMLTDEIYAAFRHQDIAQTFWHSHTYAGNPLACAASIATLDCLIQEQWLEKNKITARHFTEHLKIFAGHPCIKNIRQKGMIMAMDLEFTNPDIIRAIIKHARERGVLISPLRNVLYFMPPYCISPEEIKFLCTQTLEAINQGARTDHENNSHLCPF